MGIKINCVYNDKGAWCKNINIKRSFFGLGARCCKEFENPFKETCICRQRLRKPPPPPPPPPKKK